MLAIHAEPGSKLPNDPWNREHGRRDEPQKAVGPSASKSHYHYNTLGTVVTGLERMLAYFE